MYNDKLKDIINSSDNRMTLWSSIFKEFDLKNVAEIGVYKGEFAEYMLKNKSFQKYNLIDPWRHLDDWNKPANEKDDIFTKMLLDVKSKLSEHNEIVEYHQGTTSEVIEGFEDFSLDFGYIDADHSLKGVLVDLICWYEKIKVGGFLGGDDCDFDPYQHSLRYEPTLVFPAVLYFAEAVGDTIYLLPYNQFLIHKSSQRKFKVVNFSGLKYDDSMLSRMNFSSLKTSLIKTLKKKIQLK